MSSFRKRAIGLSQKGADSAFLSSNDSVSRFQKQENPGLRRSPITGNSTTSTGTDSLDQLLGLGAGLALGTSLLVEEEGTTDFAKALLSTYAAEGVVQNHYVFIVGPEGSLNLPGLIQDKALTSIKSAAPPIDSEKMKIAWRYQRLSSFDGRDRAHVRQESTIQEQCAKTSLFCHTYDLTKSLAIPSQARPPVYLSPCSQSPLVNSPFQNIITRLRSHLSTGSSIPTRLVIPSLLSPVLYPAQASSPHHVVRFAHELRALLRQHATLTVFISWPLALYPAWNQLTHWMRTLADGVITLRPFPHSFSADALQIDFGSAQNTNNKTSDERMQGLIQIHKLPILSERGVSTGSKDDMAFAVGRKRFTVRPFHLPPVGNDSDENASHGLKEGTTLEF